MNVSIKNFYLLLHPFSQYIFNNNCFNKLLYKFNVHIYSFVVSFGKQSLFL